MNQPLLVLKIDVDTKRGTHEGVPQLVSLFKKYNADATFLFSLGPDNTGRAIKRVFRKGFLQKVSRTSVVEHYGIRTLLNGTLLPAPDIGLTEIDILRDVEKQGFEVGIHTWDHIKWQDYVANKDPSWTQAEMKKAFDRFELIFNYKSETHGSAGWQMNESAYKYERELEFLYASDCRGKYPFIPLNDSGKIIGVPQLPTTLPTLDEIIGIDDISANNVDEYVLNITKEPPEHGHVYTLHAELEGMRLLTTFERMLQGWIKQGYKLSSMKQLFTTLNHADLPYCHVEFGSLAGRSGLLALQGKESNPN